MWRQEFAPMLRDREAKFVPQCHVMHKTTVFLFRNTVVNENVFIASRSVYMSQCSDDESHNFPSLSTETWQVQELWVLRILCNERSLIFTSIDISTFSLQVERHNSCLLALREEFRWRNLRLRWPTPLVFFRPQVHCSGSSVL